MSNGEPPAQQPADDRGAAGTVFGTDFATTAYPPADDRDHAGVAAQVGSLGASRTGSDDLRRALRGLQERRSRPQEGLAARPVLQFSLLPDQDSLTLVVDELLMMAADLDGSTAAFRRGPARDVLAQADFHDPVPVDELDRRLVRLVPRSASVQTLRDVAARLRELGYPCGLNHVAPLNPIIKGTGGPENTARTLSFPPPWTPQLLAAPSPVTVAVIDTGITAADRSDGWLAGVADAAGPSGIDPLDVYSWDDTPGPDGYLDYGAGHGTFVAGIVQQVAPKVTVRSYRAVDSDGIGSEVDVAKAMLAAARDGATVINLSLGSETDADQPPLAIRVALDLLAEQFPDVLCVAAAGNSGTERPAWPAAFREVVSVAALRADLQPAAWSNRGSWVDCSTIGEGVFSTYVRGVEYEGFDPPGPGSDGPDTFPEAGPDAPEEPWALWSGTSFAAPQIAGAIARISQERGIPPREACRRMLGLGVPVPGYGTALHLLPGS
ncbi:S8 family peptidase [Nakamurella leprariae]|uniref:S8 family serine peptidase n=1 Tax=Nakamurella leprariae TaxID=2803911 RepID=A0A939C2E3_9ACTN|nr:S8 family serine peptidase [Nakamurella leprariae]MBM9468027.1 S8 family serine peptidase [Nakamurella leprariae]